MKFYTFKINQLIFNKINLVLMFLFVSLVSFSQVKRVTGEVRDAAGETLIGVSVAVEGTSIGTITNIDGQYSINVEEGRSLTFSYIGKTPQTIKVGKSDVIDVTLSDDAEMLQEVVVEVGYGKIKKRDLTGSIVSIRGDEINTVPTSNPINALQGKVPGLNVTNVGGAGTSPQITIRGIGTMKSGTNPIFVVDGMILDNIDFVNPNDIQSIEVLKDASSLAIFGVQGANGVIIITTNKAVKGVTQVKYDGYAGVQHLFNRDKLKLTDATEFTVLYNENLQNMQGEQYIPWEGNLIGKGTDWQDEIMHSAFITNHFLTVSNSSDKSKSLLSAGYFKQDGIVKYNDYQRFNLNYSTEITINEYIKTGANVNLSRWDMKPASASVQGASRAIPTYAPYAPEEDWNPKNPGSYYTPSPSIQKDVANPVARMELLKGTEKSHGWRGVGNAFLELSFLKDFTFKTTGFFDVGINYGDNYTPYYDVNNETSISSQKSLSSNFKKTNGEYTKYQADFLLNYNKEIEKNSIVAMVGYTAYEKTAETFGVQTDSIFNNMPNLPEDMWVLDNSSIRKSTTRSYSSEAFISYISRVNYSYDSKYLATATFRADGSSKFAPKKRWGYFPSIGLGWVASQENFMKQYDNVINFLKLKTSWGRLGNDKIGNYQYFRTINPTGQMVIVDGKPVYLPTVDGIADPNLHWEVMTGFDAGFDAAFLKQRLSVEFGYYDKKTSDLLAYVAVPASVGAGYKVTNAGSMKNTGVEFSIGWQDNIGEFSYRISANGSTVRNRVISIGNDNAPIQSDSYHRTAVGHPIGSFYGYVQDGIFQSQQEVDEWYKASWISRPGDIRYKKLTKEGDMITDKDRTFIGSPIPTFIYGINLGGSYKNFDFQMNFNGVAGNKILNLKKIPGFTQFNYYHANMDRWHGPGTSNFEPILDASRSHNFFSSTNLIESGNYFRVKEIQVGYTFSPELLKKAGMSNMRLYCDMQNLLTFKKSTGYTPEIGGSILTGGVDNGGTYPLPTTFTCGLSLSF